MRLARLRLTARGLRRCSLKLTSPSPMLGFEPCARPETAGNRVCITRQSNEDKTMTDSTHGAKLVCLPGATTEKGRTSKPRVSIAQSNRSVETAE